MTIKTSLLALFERNNKIWATEHDSLPLQVFDEEWISPCQIKRINDENLTWKAVEQPADSDLSNIEEALEVTLHPSIKDLFCTFYAAGLPCLFDGHPIELIQVWNQEDLKILQENMIAHFMMQKRLKKPASMFIASCSDDMQIISILNETGEVQLETLGKKQEAILAPNLVEFLDKLQPVATLD